MEKAYWFLIIAIGCLLIMNLIFLRFVYTPEDSWIKVKGVYVKHGNPSTTPNYVKEQEIIVNCSKYLYNAKKQLIGQFSSECLGVCGNYSVDIVHVPRIDLDNLPENQCDAYKTGLLKHFVELDKEGNIVRIV
jgi:hypothetical protein